MVRRMSGWVDGYGWVGMEGCVGCHAVQLSCPPSPLPWLSPRHQPLTKAEGRARVFTRGVLHTTPPQARGAAGRTSLYLPISPYISLYLPIPQARGAAGHPDAEALGHPGRLHLGRTRRDTQLLGPPAPVGRCSRLSRCVEISLN